MPGEKRVRQAECRDLANRFRVITREIEVRQACNPAPCPQLRQRRMFWTRRAVRHFEYFCEIAVGSSADDLDLPLLGPTPFAEQYNRTLGKQIRLRLGFHVVGIEAAV